MRRHLLSLLCLVAAFIGVVSAQSNPVSRADHATVVVTSSPTEPVAQGRSVSFAKPVVYSSGGWDALSLAVADLNNDGYLDIVVANKCPSFENCPNGEVSVLLGNAQGTFQSQTTYNSGGVNAAFLVVGDLRRNGIRDLVVANQCQDSACNNGAVSVLLGNGDGTFQTAVSYGSGGYVATSVAVGDVNGDGVQDLVVSNECAVAGNDCLNGLIDGSIGVLLGNGDGTFQSPVSYDSGGVNAFAVALANLGGGPLDLIVTTVCPGFRGCVAVLPGNGGGTFQKAAVFPASPNAVDSIAVADLNGDGKLDVAVTVTSNGVSVLLGNGDGTLQEGVAYDSGGEGGSFSLAIGDLNGDGIPDLSVTNLCRTINRAGACVGGSVVGVLLGNGNGAFQTPLAYSTGGTTVTSVAIGDINGDGRPDLVAANSCPRSGSCANSVMGVLLNKTLRAATTTTLTSSPNPSQVNQAVTFTATITSSRIIPDGQVVQFYDGTVEMGTGTTTKGVATFVTSFSKAKTYAIKAKYAGGGFLGASSWTVKQKVVNPE
jgi:FG-GAP-like repeat/Bacterial Ig-like domain (group 3)/FG-GAP repeat